MFVYVYVYRVKDIIMYKEKKSLVNGHQYTFTHKDHIYKEKEI